MSNDTSGNGEDKTLGGIANFLYKTAKPFLVQAGPAFLGQVIEDLSVSMKKQGYEKAGAAIGTAVPWLTEGAQKLIAYGDNANDYLNLLKDAVKGKKNTLRDVAPYLVAEGKKASSLSIYKSNNSVIQAEAMRIVGRAKFDTISSTISLANSVLVDQTSGNRPPLSDEGDLEDELPFQETRKPDGADPKKTMELMGKSLLGAAVTPVTEYVQEHGKKTLGKPTPLDFIRLIAKAGQNDQIIFNKDSMDTDVAILEAFKASRVWSNGAPITEKARCYEELVAASQTIAREIQSGGLDAFALIELIGNDKVIGADNKVVKPEQLARAMRDAQEIALSANPNFVKEYITSTEYTEAELKETIGNMPEEYQPVFTSFIPRIVLEKIGFKKEQVEAWENADRDSYMDALISVLENIDRQSEEALVESGLKSREARQLKLGAADLLQRNDQEINEFLSSKAGKKFQHVLLNDTKLWTDRIKEPRNAPLDLSGEEPRGEAEAVRGVRPRGASFSDAVLNRDADQQIQL